MVSVHVLLASLWKAVVMYHRVKLRLAVKLSLPKLDSWKVVDLST